MKVLIVLVLVVVFAGCEESTQELKSSHNCDCCHEGLQFTRKNIEMDLDVIWLDFADSRSKWPLKFLCISRHSKRRSKGNTAAPFTSGWPHCGAEKASMSMETSLTIKSRKENPTGKFVNCWSFASQILYSKFSSKNLTVLILIVNKFHFKL